MQWLFRKQSSTVKWTIPTSLFHISYRGEIWYKTLRENVRTHLRSFSHCEPHDSVLFLQEHNLPSGKKLLCATKKYRAFIKPAMICTLTCFVLWVLITCILFISCNSGCSGEGKSMVLMNFKATESLWSEPSSAMLIPVSRAALSHQGACLPSKPLQCPQWACHCGSCQVSSLGFGNRGPA